MLALVLMETGVTVDPISLLANYGIAGIVIVLIVTGQLRTKSEVLQAVKIADDRAREIAEKDAAMAALMQQITQHTLPQMTALADVLDRLQDSGGPVESSVADQLSAINARLAALDAHAKDGP